MGAASTAVLPALARSDVLNVELITNIYNPEGERSLVTTDVRFRTHLTTVLLRLRPRDTLEQLGRAMTPPRGFCARPAVREVMGARRMAVTGAAVMAAIFASGVYA